MNNKKINNIDEKFQTGNVLLISISHFVHDVFSSFLAPILPLLINKLALSYSMAGLLTVAQRLPSLLNPFMGLIADRVRIKYLLVIAPAITSVSMSLLGIAPNYGILLLLLFSMGLGATCFHVPGPVIINAVSGNRVGKGMSFYMLGGEIARALGPIVILAAISLWTLEGTWKLIPFGLSASIFLFFRFRKMIVKRKQIPVKRKSNAFYTFKTFLPLFTVLLGYSFFRSLLRSSLTVFLPTYLSAKGNSLWLAGISLTAVEFSGALGTYFGGSLSDYIGRRKMLLIISIISPLLGWIFLLTDGLFSFIVLLFSGFFLIAAGPVMLALVQDVQTDRPSFLNGIYMTINFISGALSAILIGWWADISGLAIAFRIAFTLSFLALPFILLLKSSYLEH